MGILQALRQRTDAYKAKDLARFRYWHVEALISQAGDLLDKCLAQRQYLRILEERKVEITLAVSGARNELTLLRSRLAEQAYYQEERILNAGAPQREIVWSQLQAASGAAGNLPTGPQRDLATSQAWVAYNSEDANNAARAASINAAQYERKRLISNAEQRILNIEEWISNLFIDKDQTRFYLEDQISAQQELIDNGFQDAYDRATVAAQGLKKIYGYGNIFPLSDLVTPDLSLLDATNQWLRAATRWLTARLQYDQIFTKVYSLKTLVDDAVFANAMEGLAETGKGDVWFRLGHDDLPNHIFVRLRGITMVGVGLSAPLSAGIEIPRAAISQQRDESGVINEQPLDQKKMPICLIGRIEDVSATRAPEIVGMHLISNASPFGALGQSGLWRIALNTIRDEAKCDDILLEISLAGRPV